MNKFYVYTHTRPDTGEIFYVGKGSGNRSHIKQKRNIVWNRIVSKNKGLYTITIVYDNLSENEAHAKEIELIFQYGRINNKTGSLCNMTDGGDGTSGHKHSVKTRKQFSLSKQGSKHPMFGKHHTNDTKLKMRLKKVGKPSNWKGKSASQATRDKIRNSLLGRPSPKKGAEGSNTKIIINTVTGNIVAQGVKDFYRKGLAKDRAFSTVVNYFAGWKEEKT